MSSIGSSTWNTFAILLSYDTLVETWKLSSVMLEMQWVRGEECRHWTSIPFRCWVIHPGRTCNGKLISGIWSPSLQNFSEEGEVCVCVLSSLCFECFSIFASWMTIETSQIYKLEFGYSSVLCRGPGLLMWDCSWHVEWVLCFIPGKMDLVDQMVPDTYTSWQKNFWSFRMRYIILKLLLYLMMYAFLPLWFSWICHFHWISVLMRYIF